MKPLFAVNFCVSLKFFFRNSGGADTIFCNWYNSIRLISNRFLMYGQKQPFATRQIVCSTGSIETYVII